MVTKILKKVSFFKALGPGELKRLMAISSLRRCRKGELVFSKEDTGNNFFIVKSGRVKIFSVIGPDKRKTFAYLGKGDFFGEMSLLGGKVRSASAQAVEESELLVISRKNFRTLILKSPDFTFGLLHTLVSRLDRCDREIESMLFHNILGRLAGSLVDLAGKRSTGVVRMNMSQTDIADYMGSTRVPVCRAMNVLKRDGIISYKRGELAVLDMPRLRSMAGSAS